MPLERQGNSVIFYAFYQDSVGQGVTGLTVTADVWEISRSGSSTEIVSATSATEIGDGLYRYLLVAGSVDAAAEYICVFKTASGSVAQKHLAAIWVVDRAGLTEDVIADEVWAGISEGAYTYAEVVRILLAVISGKSSGGGTSQIQFRDVADLVDRVDVTVDTRGNRVAVNTRDGS